MFALIFMWTPPHFWALALFMKDDYDNAGVPMLTVTHGRRVDARTTSWPTRCCWPPCRARRSASPRSAGRSTWPRRWC